MTCLYVWEDSLIFIFPLVRRSYTVTFWNTKWRGHKRYRRKHILKVFKKKKLNLLFRHPSLTISFTTLCFLLSFWPRLRCLNTPTSSRCNAHFCVRMPYGSSIILKCSFWRASSFRCSLTQNCPHPVPLFLFPSFRVTVLLWHVVSLVAPHPK